MGWLLRLVSGTGAFMGKKGEGARPQKVKGVWLRYASDPYGG